MDSLRDHFVLNFIVDENSGRVPLPFPGRLRQLQDDVAGAQTCRERGGTYAHARAHAHVRNLPSPEALIPEIEEGTVNRRASDVACPRLWPLVSPASSAILDPTSFTGGEVVT